MNAISPQDKLTFKPSTIVLAIGLIIFASWAHQFFGDLDIRIALTGWYPQDFTNYILYPENFKRDYPGGNISIGTSILPWVYPMAASVGIPVGLMNSLMITLEIVVFIYGAMFLLKSLFGNIETTALFIVIAVFAMSSIIQSNLAQIGIIFHGQFYGFAEGLRLFAIGSMIRGKHQSAALALALAFTIHPIKALCGFVFIGGALLANWREIFSRSVFLPYGLSALFIIIWAYLWLNIGQSDWASMTENEFFKYSPLFNYHWFPQNLGLLESRHLYFATAFISALLVATSTLMRSDLPSRLTSSILFGGAAIVGVTLLGLYLAWFEISATLVKICLQRASILILLVIAVLLIGQLFADIKAGKWGFAALLLAFLLIPFYTLQTYPVIIALAYAIASIFSQTRQQPHARSLLIITISLLLISIAYQLFLFNAGYQRNHPWIWQLTLLGFILIATIIHKIVAKKHQPTAHSVMRVAHPALLIAFIGSAVTWSVQHKLFSANAYEKGVAYKNVQLWAKDNTQYDALFMTDPTTAYGWRDFSQRSSFGTIQEWYKIAWLYSGKQKILHQGIEYGETLGINQFVPDRHEYKGRRSHYNSKIRKQALTSYYSPDGASITNIAKKYQVQYFVMDLANAEKYGSVPSNWPIAFKNHHFIVIAPPS